MTDNTENLVLEHLRHIRARVDQIADDMTDFKHRMSGLEQAIESGQARGQPWRGNRYQAADHLGPAGGTH